MKKVVILSNKNTVARVVAHDGKISKGAKEVPGITNGKYSGLKVLTDAINAFAEDEEPTEFFVISAIADYINKGTFKFHAVSGKKLNGEKLPAKELQIVKEFAEKYADRFDKTIIKDMSQAFLPETSQFEPTEDQLVNDMLVRLAKETLPKKQFFVKEAQKNLKFKEA